MKDYRLKENRLAGFQLWYEQQVLSKEGDCDSEILKYIIEKQNWKFEDQVFFCFLFSITGSVPTSYLIFNLGNEENYKKWDEEKTIYYDTDRRWNKGKLSKQIESFYKWYEKAESNLQKWSFEEHFELMDKMLFNYGRLQIWNFCEFLNSLFEIKVENLLLNDFENSRSNRNGLCYATNHEEWIDQKLSEKDYQWLEEVALDTLKLFQSIYPEKAKNFNYYNLETSCCSYKKAWKGSRYIGYYIDDQYEDLVKVEKTYPEIDWKIFWEARENTFEPKYLTNGVQKQKLRLFKDYGIIENPRETYEIGLETFFK